MREKSNFFYDVLDILKSGYSVAFGPCCCYLHNLSCVPHWSFCPNPFLWEMQFQYYLYKNFLLSCLVSSQPTTDKRLPDSEHPSCSMQVDISSNPEVELAVKVWVQSLALGLVSSNLATLCSCACKEFLIHRSSVVSHIGHASTT